MDKVTGEMGKLKKMLDKQNIPYEFTMKKFGLDEQGVSTFKHFHLQVPDGSDKRIVSVIQGTATYGRKDGLLEIMGLLTKEELKESEVLGWLTAETVFERVLAHYTGKSI